MKIQKINTMSELDIKRFKIPYIIEDTCSHCESLIQLDLSKDHYLTNPKIDNTNDVYFYCENCDHEWSQSIKLHITLSPA